MDLEAGEMAIRGSMHRIGGRLLEKLLNADGGGHRGARTECGGGHSARFVDYRVKEVTTVLAPVKVQRAYYHCESCREGVIPKDRELDIVDTSFSPGVRRMMGRVGAKEPFDQGRQDLEELAGVRVTTKTVERVSETLGLQIEEIWQREAQWALCDKVVPWQAVATMYIAIDGTGVPVLPSQVEGRPGKGETGQAKTREAKLGCIFTQTGVDEKGFPVRDENATTYVGVIDSAQAFGTRIYAEAARRGVSRADRVVVLGDGARWIWGIAEEHFYGAIQIVDLYHARQHLSDLGKMVYGCTTPQAKKWVAARQEQLDAGDVEAVLHSLRRLRPPDPKVRQELSHAIEYFQKNAQRMRYAHFRKQGLFVGSGVIEAGCKVVVGQRLKQSGMRWTVEGANRIIALRCCQLSDRWEEFWEMRSTG